MTAAPKLAPLAIGRSPSVVIVGGRVVECDWCSLDGRPYVRMVEGSEHPSEDEVHLCDDCADELAGAIKNRQRRQRATHARTR